MGNCTSGMKKSKSKASTSRKGDSALDDNKSAEDVTYASIDHTTGKGSKPTIDTNDDDCAYATVNIPSAPEPDSSSSEEECVDDYVLMG